MGPQYVVLFLFRVYCFLLFMHILLFVWQIQGREKPQHVQNMHTIIRKRAGGLPLCVQIHSELVLLISWSRMPLKLRFHFTEGTSFVFYCLFVCTSCDVIEAKDFPFFLWFFFLTYPLTPLSLCGRKTKEKKRWKDDVTNS